MTAVLVMAKAPVAGLVKTRLGAVVGDETAARVAAAALLDTLSAAAGTVGAQRCHLALAGDLDEAMGAADLRITLAGWTIHPQRGRTFAERLVNAHLDVGTGEVVQIGMDTPQVTPALLAAAALPLRDHDTTLGPADDGGWWVLARRDPEKVRAIADVEMSTPTTYTDSRDALLAAGASVASTASLRDVDTVADADAVAAEAPRTRFAAAWAGALA